MFSKFKSLGILKTLWFNFRYIPLKQAYKLPFLLSSNTRIISCKRGFCYFRGGVKSGMVTIGFNRDNNNALPTSIRFDGTAIIRGQGIHAFGAGCMVSIEKNAVLDVGNNFGCTGDTRISVKKSLVIGCDNLWSYGCVIMDNDGHYIFDENHQIINEPQGIMFGDKVWMGCNCIVLKNVTIPSYSIIAAGSKITKKLHGQSSIFTTNGIVLKNKVYWKA